MAAKGKRTGKGRVTQKPDTREPIPVPEASQEALRGKFERAKQASEMFQQQRSAYFAFAEGIAATIGVPEGYGIDAESMQFVPVPPTEEPQLTE